MSEPRRSAESRALDVLVAEAKEHLDVDTSGAPAQVAHLDWDRLEARVMAAVEDDNLRDQRDVGEGDASRSRRPWSRDRLLRGTAIVLAAAAAVTLFVRKDRDAAVGDPVAMLGDGASASSLRTTEGAGEVRANRVVVTPGYVVRAGDAIEVDGPRAVFERPRKVTWLLEGLGQPGTEKRRGSAQAHVKLGGEPLVLGLDSGAIEAQVAPVAVGEAFAVDVATDRGVVRVAVHGTHLRVARMGNQITVDLTEGVVSIGVPPRTGMTYGTLVTAPAHVELDATDLRTLRVDHTPEAVRAAIPLGPSHEASAAGRPASPASLPASPPPPAPTTASNAAKGAVLRPSDIAVAMAKTDRPRPQLPPRETIAAAIRDCAAARSRSGDVRVTVTSNLSLRVSASGEVESAQFSPPLLPDIQTCAAEVIYKTKLGETGLVTIPLEFSY